MTMIKDRFLVNYKRFDTESGTYYLYNNSIKKLYNKFNITEDNEEEMLKAITVDMLEDWAMELQKQFKASTYNVITEHLKEYFFYLANKRHTLQFNPMDAISKASLEEVENDAKDKYIPTLEEVRALIESTRIKGNNEKQFEFNSVRDRAILSFLAVTGCRQSIVRELRMSMIEYINNGIAFNIDGEYTKSGKPQRIVIGNKARKYFIEWLNLRAKKGIKSELVFTSIRGSQLTRSNVKSILDKAVSKVGLNVEGKQFSPHNIRNFVATYLVQKEVNPILIKEVCHWSQNKSDMLSRYSTKDLKQFDQQKIEIMNIL